MQLRQIWQVMMTLGVLAFVLLAVATVNSQSISTAPSITVYANPTVRLLHGVGWVTCKQTVSKSRRRMFSASNSPT